jgi:hypothetical protein
VAFSRIESNTGWRSVGRAADDPQDLRRCRLLLQGLGDLGVARRSSLNNRTFSIAITALARVASKSICFCRNGCTSGR